MIVHMEKPLFECTVMTAQASRKNSQFAKHHQRPNAPWSGTIYMQVYSLRHAIHAACFQERISKHAWENWSFAAIAPPRHDRQPQGASDPVAVARCDNFCLVVALVLLCLADGWLSLVWSWASSLARSALRGLTLPGRVSPA